MSDILMIQAQKSMKYSFNIFLFHFSYFSLSFLIFFSCFPDTLSSGWIDLCNQSLAQLFLSSRHKLLLSSSLIFPLD